VEPGDVFDARMTLAGATLGPAARKVLLHISQNRVAVLASSAAEIAAAVGTSDATVVRAVQALGFAGLAELRQVLIASMGGRPTPAEGMRRTLAQAGQQTVQAIDLVLQTHRDALAALQAPAARDQIAAAVAALQPCNRVVVFGIGPSAPIAGYVLMMLRRCGRQGFALDATGLALADQLLQLRSGDGLLVLAYGQPYREVEAVFAEARRLGLAIVLVTDSLEPRLARYANVRIPARRGRTGHVALHGATLVALEALVLGLAATEQQGAIATLDRLEILRERLGVLRRRPI
jgi:DNA-binding MurR/RpiR family transcriptional regulator